MFAVLPLFNSRLASHVAALLLGLSSFSLAEEPSTIPDLNPILAVGGEGSGNEDAAIAWRELVRGDSASVLPILEAMDDASPIASNYLRSALEAIIDRTLAEGGTIPSAELGAFLLERHHTPRARRLAYDIIARTSPDAAEILLPGLLHDPAPELRRDAVESLLEEAKEAPDEAVSAILYRQALDAAREAPQITKAADALEELGQSVDVPKHFGFLSHWKLIAPFSNEDRSGFDTVYPPEEKIDLNSTELSWQDYATSDRYGMVDFNQPFGMQKEVIGYAYTTFASETARPAEIRIGCKNSWKVWLNGELLFGRDEYHRGTKIDQYILPCQLRKGQNEILVKCGQNEQTEEWTVQWQFQLRVCDSTGTAILSTDRLPTPVAEKPSRRRPAK